MLNLDASESIMSATRIKNRYRKYTTELSVREIEGDGLNPFLNEDEANLNDIVLDLQLDIDYITLFLIT